jgi:hypothetical protein
VFVRPQRPLTVSVTADQPQYCPGDTVKLRVRVTDADGAPVPSALCVAVTDESVRAMLEQRKLPPRLPAAALFEAAVDRLEDALKYTSGDADADECIDLLLGVRGAVVDACPHADPVPQTQGWRRFAYVDRDEFLAKHGADAYRALAFVPESSRKHAPVRRLYACAARVLSDADWLQVAREWELQGMMFGGGGPRRAGMAMAMAMPMPVMMAMAPGAPPPAPAAPPAPMPMLGMPPGAVPPAPAPPPMPAAVPEMPMQAPVPAKPMVHPAAPMLAMAAPMAPPPPPMAAPMVPMPHMGPMGGRMLAVRGSCCQSAAWSDTRSATDADPSGRVCAGARVLAQAPRRLRAWVRDACSATRTVPDLCDSHREDFTQTVAWRAALLTAEDGTAEVVFDLNDSVTQFRAAVDAVSCTGVQGSLGSGDLVVASRSPFYVGVHAYLVWLL